MQVNLLVAEGPLSGSTFSFRIKEAFVLGRSRRAHLRLPKADRYISRMHFLLEFTDQHCKVMDLGSRNGTYLNGRRIDVAELNDGDRLKVGRTIFQVHLND